MTVNEICYPFEPSQVSRHSLVSFTSGSFRLIQDRRVGDVTAGFPENAYRLGWCYQDITRKSCRTSHFFNQDIGWTKRTSCLKPSNALGGEASLTKVSTDAIVHIDSLDAINVMFLLSHLYIS